MNTHLYAYRPTISFDDLSKREKKVLRFVVSAEQMRRAAWAI